MAIVGVDFSSEKGCMWRRAGQRPRFCRLRRSGRESLCSSPQTLAFAPRQTRLPTNETASSLRRRTGNV
eukprot:3184597-Rhodomonas_salina.1